jgi:hypothetical protein
VGCKGVVAFFSPGMSTGNSTWCESILLFFLHAENTNKIPYYGRGTKKQELSCFTCGMTVPLVEKRVSSANFFL